MSMSLKFLIMYHWEHMTMKVVERHEAVLLILNFSIKLAVENFSRFSIFFSANLNFVSKVYVSRQCGTANLLIWRFS